MSICCLLFAATRSFLFDIILGFVFGLGFGTFSSVDWAMATDCLPSSKDTAKDMGVWGMAFILPQMLAQPIAGTLSDYFEKVGPVIHLGYTVIFCLSTLYFIIGTWLVKFIVAVK